MLHRVVLLTAILIDTSAGAQPAPDAHAWSGEPGPEPLIGAAELADLANLTERSDPPAPTDHPAPTDTVLQVVEPPADPPERRMPMEEAQMYAVPLPVPLPGRRSRDPSIRKARGMLAGGIVFTVICSAGSALAIAAAILSPRRISYGTESEDYVRAVTGLIACTAGAIGLAAAGAVRIRRIRHLAEWTGGLGLRF